MKFTFRVLTQYGTDPETVYNKLSEQFTRIEVHEELKPYKHYHGLLQADTDNISTVQRLFGKIQKLHEPIRKKHNLFIAPVFSNEHYFRLYISKEHGCSYTYKDVQTSQLTYDFDEELDRNEVDNTECQFSPCPMHKKL